MALKQVLTGTSEVKIKRIFFHLLVPYFLIVFPLAVDPHSFVADPDPPAFLIQFRIQLTFFLLPFEAFSGVEKYKQKNCSKVENRRAGPNLPNFLK